MTTRTIHRRQALRTLGAAIALSPALKVFAGDRSPRLKIGACDWSIQARGDVAAVEKAAKLGLDGVQVSFGRPGEKFDLRRPEVRAQYQAACKEHGMEIASLAMGVLNQVPYATEESAEQWVEDCVELMPKLDQKIVLLAFFSKGDIKGRPDLQAEVVRRLKRVAPKAEKAGVVLGIESWLSADEHLRILDAVGSPAVRVYYDVANMEKMGYDIYAEIGRLGRERICQIHCKENGFLLGQGRVDFRKVKHALDEIGWRGWLIIEGAVPPGGDPFASYVKNRKFLRHVFAS